MNLTLWQTILLSLLQGLTELFPISSLGHTVIVPGLLNWGDLVHDERFLPLITALHLGTSIALVIYFWRDWLQVCQTLVISVKEANVQTGTEGWVNWLIILGCIPAGILGVFLEKPLKALFASPFLAATFLIVNGLLLLLGEWWRRKHMHGAKGLPPKEREIRTRPLSSLKWWEALLIGCAQALALIPGISRSGATMVAGLGARLSHEDAARFSFLLGTPLIGAAALLEVPQLFHVPAPTLGLICLGMVLSGIMAFLSTKFLMRYFETGRLDPFAYYCIGAGALSLLLFIFLPK
ncbi:undecaprenyl-diphosphate phosphatase [Ktedonospora formicarum]|uniref:Undecaprenyl-diphosphatase n=1 Tax=Ktedonospora formicarum TaxID=2778364 RepID=A0A8J3HY29_9CHLR|nr:undecaprenyl-diphosphate phosphatase [Ktedonospora formicarum]GHO45854.1 undecaprenyl-diphosphatase 1 [Ktedonospora formicarum]